MNLPKIDLKELAQDKEENFKRRLQFIREYARWVKRTKDNDWSSQQKELIEWVKECKDHKVNPIQSKKDRNLIGFVKKFGSNLRTILTKKKEGYFLELFF